MRKTGICPKCTHNQLVHIGAVADTGEYPSEIRDMYLAVVYMGDGFLGGEKRERAGKLSAIVCRRCGFTELYVVDPQSLQIDGRYITKINGPDPTGPFR